MLKCHLLHVLYVLCLDTTTCTIMGSAANRPPKHLGTFILLLMVTVLPFSTGQYTYYVKPTPDTPCHEDPCHTLSEYASEAERYFTSNTTMVFLPGEHALQENVNVRDVGRLAFIGHSSSSPADVSRIICTDASLTFTNTIMLEVTNLGFLSCGIQLEATSAVFQNGRFENSTSDFDDTADYGGAIYAYNSTITFEGETRFEGNKAALAGGGIFAEESNLAFHGNTTFINNEAMQQGGGICIVQCDLIFAGNVSFIANVAVFGGGGVCIHNSTLKSNFENNVSFFGNSAANGGGILVKLSNVILGSSFIQNSAEWNGGGVYIEESSVSFGDNSSFTNNSVWYSGGGVYVDESTVSFGDNSSFTNNSAEYKSNRNVGGGGVYVDERTVSFGDNSSFTSNSAEYGGGGGVYVKESSVSFSDNSYFTYNSAEYGGGGVYVDESTVSFGENSSFTCNSAGYGGGGFYIEESSVSFGDNSSFTNNSVWYSGGGVYVDESTVSFGDNSSFTNTSAEYKSDRNVGGGGVYVKESSVSFSDNSYFTYNSAEYGGGGVYVDESTVSFGDNSSFTCNSAGWYGSGGGVHIEESSVSFGDNSSFTNNSAEYGSGGGVYVDESTVSFGDNSSFTNTSAEYKSDRNVGGGGVYVKESSVSFSDNSYFTYNSAEYGVGGGVYVDESTVSFGDNSSFTCNSAGWYGSGGGVHIEESSVSFGDNSSFTNNSVWYSGGGVYVDESTVSFGDNSSFTNNSAEYGGGGVHVKESTVSFGDSSSFTNNSVWYSGGGVYVDESIVSFGDNSSFTNNSAEYGGGGVHVKESTVSFGDSSSFTSNSAEYVGGGGGVYVKESSVSFSDNSYFTYNSAEYGGGGVYVDESTVSFGENSSFTNNSAGYGSGGGVYVEGSSVSFGDNSSFTNNSVWYSGGGVYVDESIVSFGDISSFTCNSAEYDGGGGVYAWRVITVSFGNNCSFISNSAKYGGGVYVVGSTVSLGDNSSFNGNSALYYGGCVAAEESAIDMSSSDFMNNLARYGGCIFVDTCSLTLSGSNTFSGNTAMTSNGNSGSSNIWGYGGVILALSTRLVFGGSHVVTNNSAGYGGAIYFTLDSKLYLLPSTSMSFETNFAQYRGGALFVEGNPFSYCILDDNAQLDLRDVCFIQMHEFQTIQTLTVRVWGRKIDSESELQFQDNAANEAGNVLYGGSLASCGVITNVQGDYVTGNEAFNTWANVSSTLMSSDPYRVCICVDNNPDCSQNVTIQEVYPGVTFVVPVVAFGQYDGAVPAVIHTYVSEGIALDDLQHTQQSGNSCTDLQYTVRLSARNISMNKSSFALYADEPCSILGIPLEIPLEFKDCPPAFSLSSKGTCECERRLHKYEVDCDINDQSILRKDSIWVGFDQQSEGLILHQHCPFDYCKPETDSVNFTMNNTDLQCNSNRSGHLCGACQRRLSLAVGSSRCLPCSNKFLALLLPFVIAGFALVIFLFICKVTIAAGTISGLIFYANIVTVNQSIFFPSGETNILTVFIAWLNLDLGIESCFFDGMDAYSMTWLQHVFPIYIWLLVGLIAILCNVSTTAARILGSTNPIAVLATLFLLSYTKILRNIIVAFSFTTLEYPDDEIKVVWLYDGNIGYLDKNDGRHIALFLASLLVFLFLFLPYTLFLLFGQCILPRLDPSKLRCLSWANYLKMKSFLDAHHAPYKDRHRYWIGLLLVLRFILFLISAIVDVESPQNPRVNLLVIIISSVGLAMWGWNASGGVYKKWYLNALESSFIFNIAIFAAATLYAKLAGGSQAAVSYTSVTIAFTTFIGIIIYHVYQRLRDSRAWRNLLHKHNERRRVRDHGWQREDAAADEEMEEMIPQAAPTVTYVDIPTEERRQMRPITPPLSSRSVTDVHEPLDQLQREDAAADEEMDEMLPQAAPKPPTVTYVDIPTDEHIEMRPITPPPPPPINFVDLRQPLDLLTQ